MFCSECGQEAQGKFCSNCGARIQLRLNTSGDSDQPTDWSNEVRYDILLKISEVREQLEYHSAHATRRVSGEEFLEVCEKALAPLLEGVPVSKVAAIAQPIYASWGIGTGETRLAFVSLPIGRALVAVLCSLARAGQTIHCVQQGKDGCVIEAVLPSDMWSFAGELIINIQRTPSGSKIEAAAKIKGQMFDWGKSRRCLDALFHDVHALPRAG